MAASGVHPFSRQEAKLDNIPDEHEITPEQRELNRSRYQAHYSNADLLLRKKSDFQFNIEFREIEGKQYPAGVAILRDATKAKKLDDPSINLCQIEQNNTLLRVLGRLRSVDYVLMKKIENAIECDKKILWELRDYLYQEYAALVKNVFKCEEELIADSEQSNYFQQHQAKLDELEKTFNTLILCQTLHKANLDQGCSTVEDYEKLLFHYRNLSSLIDPARTLITVTLDEKNNILHRRTEDPVTQKLYVQKESILKDMSEVVVFPADEQKTFHTVQNNAIQVANQAFAELMADDTRECAAQVRKKHLHTVRNAFMTTVEVIFLDEEEKPKNATDYLVNHKAKPEYTRYLMRSGTSVYIGEGETKDRVQEANKNNLKQMRQFARKKLLQANALSEEKNVEIKFHSIGLVTNGVKLIDRTKQKVMVKYTKLATEDDSSSLDAFTNAPSNAEGLMHAIQLSTKIQADLNFTEFKTVQDARISTKNIGKKKQRIQDISSLLLEHLEQPAEMKNTYWMPLVWCASGQDRTGTALEITFQNIIRDICEDVVELKKTMIETISIASRHTAVLTSLLIGGSEGCKKDSLAKNLFSKISDSFLYLKSADTNKKNKVDGKLLKSVVQTNSNFEIAQMQVLREQYLFLEELSNIGEDKSKTDKRDSLKPIARKLYDSSQQLQIFPANDRYLGVEALDIVLKLVKGSAQYQLMNAVRNERCDLERLQNLQEIFSTREYAKEFSVELLKFICAKANADINEVQSSPLIEIGKKISSEQSTHAKNVAASDLRYLVQGVEITSDLMKGYADYVARYGGTLATKYYNNDIQQLQTIQKRFAHHHYLKKIASLFFEVVGVALLVGVMATVALTVATAPVSGGLNLIALSAAIKTLAATNMLWFSAGLVGSVLTGGASLFFGMKSAKRENTNHTIAENFAAVVPKSAGLGAH